MSTKTKRFVGQKFRDLDNRNYILAQTAPNKVSLINTNAGNRYTEAVEVKQIFSITPDEWEEIVGAVGPEYFKSI